MTTRPGSAPAQGIDPQPPIAINPPSCHHSPKTFKDANRPPDSAAPPNSPSHIQSHLSPDRLPLQERPQREGEPRQIDVKSVPESAAVRLRRPLGLRRPQGLASVPGRPARPPARAVGSLSIARSAGGQAEARGPGARRAPPQSLRRHGGVGGGRRLRSGWPWGCWCVGAEQRRCGPENGAQASV